MRVDTDDLAVLLQVQQIDRDIAANERALRELPQRAVILQARAKRREVEAKKSQLDELRAAADAKLSKLGDEDSALAQKQRAKQEEIESSKGGYRDIEARTKELNGLAKRRNTLEGDIAAATEELDRIEGLLAQVDKLLSDLDAQEKTATDAFVKEGSALRQDSARRRVERDRLAADLPADLMAIYEKTAERTAGVALGQLRGESCGVCRAPIDHGRLIDLKSRGNLITCPHCGRLLIVE